MSDEVKINDSELEGVSGGWQYANGPFINYGSYLVYTVVSGDVLGGIAQRFGVTIAELQSWNNIPNPDFIRVGQKITVYPRIIR